jgi:hypothetical protein
MQTNGSLHHSRTYLDGEGFPMLRGGGRIENVTITGCDCEAHAYSGNVMIDTSRGTVLRNWNARPCDRDGGERYAINGSLYCIEVWSDEVPAFVHDKDNNRQIKKAVAKTVVELDEEFPTASIRK